MAVCFEFKLWFIAAKMFTFFMVNMKLEHSDFIFGHILFFNLNRPEENSTEFFFMSYFIFQA